MPTFNPEEIGREGFVIFTDNKYYVIPESAWKNPEHEVSKDTVGRAGVLVDRGSLLAYVPPETAAPVGAYCVVINLQNLVRP